MDESDWATDREMKDREICLKQRKPTLPECGACYNCNEPIKAGLFCDRDCREDYEKYQFSCSQKPVSL